MLYTAIFGGTFNPFHIGHYEMLKALDEDERIGKIFIMPDKIPPHKVCNFMFEDEKRIEMCRLAAEDFSKAELCLIEFDRAGKSYSYDTVKLLKKLYPNENFAFVMGGDMLIFFDKWYKYEELLKELPFIVFKRQNENCLEFDESVRKYRSLGMEIILANETIPAVSSTEIRNKGGMVKELLPQKIYEFLSKEG